MMTSGGAHATACGPRRRSLHSGGVGHPQPEHALDELRAADARREQEANTTPTNACRRAQTRMSRSSDESYFYQDVRQPTPTVAHNPKVAGSNPAPATNWKARNH